MNAASKLIMLALLLLGLPGICLQAQDGDSDVMLGNHYTETEDWDNAVRSYDAALLARIDDTEILHALSYALLQLNRYERARLVLDRILEIDDTDETAHFNLGIMYWYTDRYFLALAHAERAFELDSTNASALYFVGRINLSMDRSERALEAAERLSALDNDLADKLFWYINAQDVAVNDPFEE